MGTVLLNESVKICRLCGKEQQLPTISLFKDTDNTALKEEISFFLPIQVRYVSMTFLNVHTVLIF
jgi:hypothetical protein